MPRSHNLVLRRIAMSYAEILCPYGRVGSKALSELGNMLAVTDIPILGVYFNFSFNKNGED